MKGEFKVYTDPNPNAPVMTGIKAPIEVIGPGIVYMPYEKVNKMNIIKTEKGEVFSWCPNVEESALNQIKTIADLPFTFKHTALMPDAHYGMSMPIGGVVATKGVIVPNFVGIDIGCGMCAVKTSLTVDKFSQEKKEELLNSLSRGIPVGFAHNEQKKVLLLQQQYTDKFNYTADKMLGNVEREVFKSIYDNFFEQLGTLGGGNHFVEVQVDESGIVWIMIHSGSRNIGKQIGDFFNDIARDLNKKYYSGVPEDIPFLPTDTPEGKDYIAYMNFALQFAFYNRMVMMEEAKKDLNHLFGNTLDFEPMINIHHNYANLENYFGENVWVHRKGATLASKETVGIIPGSMGTASYIVRGLGNKLSYNSCSHGSGRIMGRMEFNRQFNTEEGIKKIEDSLKNVVHTKFRKEVSRKRKETGMMDVSESPQAYKDVEEVMNNQTDLVTPIYKLTPLVCMKG